MEREGGTERRLPSSLVLIHFIELFLGKISEAMIGSAISPKGEEGEGHGAPTEPRQSASSLLPCAN